MSWLYSRFKWVIWFAIGIAVVSVVWFFRVMFGADPDAPTRLPEVPKSLKDRVDRAEEEALEARVKARVEADKAKEILDEVASIDEGAERRKRLAEFLGSL